MELAPPRFEGKLNGSFFVCFADVAEARQVYMPFRMLGNGLYSSTKQKSAGGNVPPSYLVVGFASGLELPSSSAAKAPTMLARQHASSKYSSVRRYMQGSVNSNGNCLRIDWMRNLS
jgi:hypothetical protein